MDRRGARGGRGYRGRAGGAVRGRGRNMRSFRKTLRVLKTVTACLLLAANVLAFALSGMLGNIDYLSKKDMLIKEDLDSVTIEPEDTAVSSADTIDQDQMDEIDAELAKVQTDENGLRYMEGVTNILVLGTDGWYRNSTQKRSDVIILVSVNDITRQITLTSIMRDTYVNIPGREGNDKINAANAYGGAALAKATVENAFGIKIDNVVVVNFFAFMDIVEAVGGVEVERVRKSELPHINKTVYNMNKYYGGGKFYPYLNSAGHNVTLNGAQALGYVRIRDVGNGDYERTDRQREVLSSLINKIKSSDYRTGTKIITTASKYVSTDYSEGELIELALKAPDYKDYEIISQRIPFEDTYWAGIYKGIWILKIDFDRNREILYESVFEGTETPEETEAEEET